MKVWQIFLLIIVFGLMGLQFGTSPQFTENRPKQVWLEFRVNTKDLPRVQHDLNIMYNIQPGVITAGRGVSRVGISLPREDMVPYNAGLSIEERVTLTMQQFSPSP